MTIPILHHSNISKCHNFQQPNQRPYELLSIILNHIQFETFLQQV